MDFVSLGRTLAERGAKDPNFSKFMVKVLDVVIPIEEVAQAVVKAADDFNKGVQEVAERVHAERDGTEATSLEDKVAYVREHGSQFNKYFVDIIQPHEYEQWRASIETMYAETLRTNGGGSKSPYDDPSL